MRRVMWRTDDEELYLRVFEAAHDARVSMNAWLTETIRDRTATLEVADATPGWYMSADTRLREGITYLLTDATADGHLQWYAFFDNGDGGSCEPGYVAQAGPIVRIGRFIGAAPVPARPDTSVEDKANARASLTHATEGTDREVRNV